MRLWSAVLIAASALAVGSIPAARSDDAWSRFRGPNGSGIVESGELPAEFGIERNVVWKTAVPPGHSSPIVARDRILLTALDNEALVTISLDRASGRIVWRREAPR